MGEERFDEVVELGYFEHPAEEGWVLGLEGDSQGCFVLALGDAGLEHVLDYLFVLFVFGQTWAA